ncbi:MAG: DUF1844 domain-containing protein [Ignavibacteria bacterium]|nr:DUF1844 domain-containing protein [Ignavibacteria bacterium]
MTEQEKKLHEALFIQLILQFQTSAMIGLGKLPNPITQKIEKDLEAAKLSIDMIDMIKAKTKGNLSEEEERLILQVSKDLKLNYVDELEKEQKAKTEKKEEAKS